MSLFSAPILSHTLARSPSASILSPPYVYSSTRRASAALEPFMPANTNAALLDMREKNNRAATHYFRRAAELGFAGSQNNYGWHLYKGAGVKQNKAEAIYWIV